MLLKTVCKMNIAINHSISNINNIYKYIYAKIGIKFFSINYIINTAEASNATYQKKQSFSKNILIFFIIIYQYVVDHNTPYSNLKKRVLIAVSKIISTLTKVLILLKQLSYVAKLITTRGVIVFNSIFRVRKSIAITLITLILLQIVINVSCNAQPIEEMQNKQNKLVIYNNDIVIGNPKAKTIFIEHFAPTCAHCTDYHLKVFPEIKRKYIDTGKIAYIQRECVGNRQDLDASLLARCKNDKELYLKIMHRVLTTQDSWAYSKDYLCKLNKIAKDYNISEQEYKLCRNDNTKLETIINITKFVSSDQDFLGTPSFYINGLLFSGEYSVDALSEAIENQLQQERS